MTLMEILTSEEFWSKRTEVLRAMDVNQLAVANTPTSRVELDEDSDTDGESYLDDDSVDSDENVLPDEAHGRWRLNTPFVPAN